MSQKKTFGKREVAERRWTDMVVTARMKRDDEQRWLSARSWFGGLPTIDAERWPCSASKGYPLHHIAQINLADLPQGAKIPKLPQSGILNFFMETDFNWEKQHVVVFSEQPTAELCSPPAGCPPLYGENWPYHCKGVPTVEQAPRVFRRWPIEFMLLPLIDGNYPDSQAVLNRIGPKPESIHIFGPQSLADIQPAEFPWETVRRIVCDYQYTVNQHIERRKYLPEWFSKDTPEQQQETWLRENQKLN
jgi:Domain of unknown function (DUF1963)